MRIAIVGSGVSSLVAAHLLRRDHAITVFEASHRIGGHVSTVTVDDDRGSWDIDTGFIVYNEQNYPLFTRLLNELDVDTQPSDMSFSVRCERTGMEYNGSTLNQLFVQRRNLLSPRRSVLEIPVEFFVRFLENHGMLSVDGRPEWRVVRGGSARYVEALVLPLRGGTTATCSVRFRTASRWWTSSTTSCPSDRSAASCTAPWCVGSSRRSSTTGTT